MAGDWAALPCSLENPFKFEKGGLEKLREELRASPDAAEPDLAAAIDIIDALLTIAGASRRSSRSTVMYATGRRLRQARGGLDGLDLHLAGDGSPR